MGRRIIDSFNTIAHTITLSEDGSFTAYSKEYHEHYHSTKDGALRESLTKHVIPAFELLKEKGEINILDICFGLGFNTLATLYYIKLHKIKTKINIYSPELDATLVDSLAKFTYPKEFDEFKELILELTDTGSYNKGLISIDLYVGDAREYIRTFSENTFDIIYQDAFSPSSNPILWTKEYFEQLAKIIKKDGILTTYSVALKTRLALYENNFNVYIYSSKDVRDFTIASLSEVNELKKVDIAHKISCNPNVKVLRDSELNT